MKNLKETSVYVMVSNELINTRRYGWNDQCTDIIIESTFSAFASFLGMVKNKDVTTAVVIKDIYGEFSFGAFVQFHKSEEEGTDEGSWTLSYTFDKNDIEDNWKVYDFGEDMEVANEFYTVAYTKYHMGFSSQPKDDNNAKPSYLDGIIDQLRVTEGVEVAILLNETEKGVYKVSMRSNNDVNVSEIAVSFGGGGHIKAAGCSISGSVEEITQVLVDKIKKQL